MTDTKDDAGLQNQNDFYTKAAAGDSEAMPDLMAELAKIVDPNQQTLGQEVSGEDDAVPDFVKPQSPEPIINEQDLQFGHDETDPSPEGQAEPVEAEQVEDPYSFLDDQTTSLVLPDQGYTDNAEPVNEQLGNMNDFEEQDEIFQDLTEKLHDDDALQMHVQEEATLFGEDFENSLISEIQSKVNEKDDLATAEKEVSGSLGESSENLPDYEDFPDLPDMNEFDDLPDDYTIKDEQQTLDAGHADDTGAILRLPDGDAFDDMNELDFLPEEGNEFFQTADDSEDASGPGIAGKLVAFSGLLVMAVGGYFAYSYWKDRPPENPPVIEAQNTQLKTIPENQGEQDVSENREIYNQVEGNQAANTTEAEKMVAREEAILPENEASLQNGQPNADQAEMNSNGVITRKVKTVRLDAQGNIIEEPASEAQATESQTQVASSEQTSKPVINENGVRDVTQKIDEVAVQANEDAQNAANKVQDVADTVATQTGDAASNTQEAASEKVQKLMDEAKKLETESGALPPTPLNKPDAPQQPAQAEQNAQQNTQVAQAQNQVNEPEQLQPQAQQTQAQQTQAPADTGYQQQAVPAGAYFVQLTAQRSDPAAKASFATIKSRNQDMLGTVQVPFIQRADLSSGTWYRAGVLVNSKQAANDFCQVLKANGQDCIVRKP